MDIHVVLTVNSDGCSACKDYQHAVMATEGDERHRGMWDWLKHLVILHEVVVEAMAVAS